MRIRLANPAVSDEARKAVFDVFDSGQLVAGPQVARFEEMLKQLTGRSHAVALSSGTAALVAGMWAMGVGAGSVVIVPAFTFPAPAMAAMFLGAEVRLCDVDPDTWNLSPVALRGMLTPDVSLVVPVDLFGMPAPIPEIEAICSSSGIPLLVDAACSLGSSLNGQPCGSLGYASVFSFHPRKIITTGEGGALLTDDADLAQKVMRFRNQGIEGDSFVSAGINLRPSELGAAIGSSTLPELSRRIQMRNAIAEVYHELPLRFQKTPEYVGANFQSIVVCLPQSPGSSARDELIRFLSKRGIEARRAGWSLATVDPLRDRFHYDPDKFPVAGSLHLSGVALPAHERLSIIDAHQVVACVSEWLLGRGEKA